MKPSMLRVIAFLSVCVVTIFNPFACRRAMTGILCTFEFKGEVREGERETQGIRDFIVDSSVRMTFPGDAVSA